MKETIIAIMLLGTMILTSCSAPTKEEIEQQQKICDLNGERLYINSFNNPICIRKSEPTSVMDCIREYTDGLDEKYNNPDTVSNLREDDYSKVVKTCNEIFGKK